MDTIRADGWEGDSKFVAPLSPTTDVLIYFDGARAPDAACFVRLRQFVDIIERAMLGEPGNRKAKKCKVHPNGARDPITNRCLACMKAMAENMNRKRREKRQKTEVA